MITPQSEKSDRTLALEQASGSTISPHDCLAGERLISRSELCLFVTASDMALWRWSQAGKFPSPLYIGTRRFWKSTDIARWLEAKKTEV